MEKDFYQKVDIHIHVPEGAIPKDGPSAGIAMATAIASTLMRVPIKKDTAMTGEITLRGKVLPIGGLKEKILAAHRGLIPKVLVPKENEKDIKEIPATVLKKVKISFVEHMDDVLRQSLVMEKVEELFKKKSDVYQKEEVQDTTPSDRIITH